VETPSLGFAGTFDLALWCKLLRDRGWTGQQVARALARSEGYVNNLIRILERASLEVLARWKAEQAPASGLVPICATDWLMQVCILPHPEQDVHLAALQLERHIVLGSDAGELFADAPHLEQGKELSRFRHATQTVSLAYVALPASRAIC